ncbi:zf-HC2 domain-containing protein, partial [Streptomyces sp. NPDC005568]|uniref:zf-HC2 domain-containing protein n=1 Tax=Streptomyces sp. NPDC005568 TaxID=3156887 RepID=UPI0033B9F74E
MTTEHERVRELLADWAAGALPPSDEKTVPSHLAGCESCAAEAERLQRPHRPPEPSPAPTPWSSASDWRPSSP